MATCPHCRRNPKTVDHLATQCEKMLFYDYTRRYNDIVRCMHLVLCLKYGLKALPRMRSHFVREIVSNENCEIRVDIRVPRGIKMAENSKDIMIQNKKRREIILIEVGITRQEQLVTARQRTHTITIWWQTS